MSYEINGMLNAKEEIPQFFLFRYIFQFFYLTQLFHFDRAHGNIVLNFGNFQMGCPINKTLFFK